MRINSRCGSLVVFFGLVVVVFGLVVFGLRTRPPSPELPGDILFIFVLWSLALWSLVLWSLVFVFGLGLVVYGLVVFGLCLWSLYWKIQNLASKKTSNSFVVLY